MLTAPLVPAGTIAALALTRPSSEFRVRAPAGIVPAGTNGAVSVGLDPAIQRVQGRSHRPRLSRGPYRQIAQRRARNHRDVQGINGSVRQRRAVALTGNRKVLRRATLNRT